MNSHPFDAFARLLAHNVSRRGLFRWIGASAVGVIAARVGARPAQAANQRVKVVHQFDNGGGWWPDLPPLPPAEPWSPDNPPDLDEIINDYLDCISTGRTPEECDRGFPVLAPFDWCQILWDVLTEAMPTLAGFASTFTPFSRNCGERDCFQCCYNGTTGGCHSSFIGFPVINCNESTYGAGTKAVGLTFIIDPDSVEPGDSCLFIPQVCAHIAQCVSETSASAVMGDEVVARQANQAQADNYLTDPRAVEHRARYFATQVQDEVRDYLDAYNTSTADAPSFHSLAEALTSRGRAKWRSDLTNTPINISHPALRINDNAGNLNESASWSNAAHLLGLARVLSGVPNLAARLEYVESRKWTQTDKDAYLASISDPDQALQGVLDPHWFTILQRVMMLQDYALLAVPLAGEVATEGTFGGQTLGKAPALNLRATTSEAEVTLSINMDDPEDVVGGLARPLAVDWGDGRVTHYSLPAGQTALDATHAYEAAGRYAVYAVASNDSGLRGHAALVVEVQAPAQPPPVTLPSVARIHLSGFSITNWLSPKRFSVEARLADAAGQGFRAGRSAPGGSTTANVPFAFGDLYAHNPARFAVSLLSLDIRSELTVPASRVFMPYINMAATMTLGVFATSKQTLVEHPVALTPEMMKVYLAGASTSLPSNTVTVEANGALRIPLFWRESSTAPWQKIARVDIELTPAMFDGFRVDNSSLPAPTGTHRAAIEIRPGAFGAVPSRAYLPIVSN
jgi:hypothetical protein